MTSPQAHGPGAHATEAHSLAAHGHPTTATYIKVGVVLAILTIIEVALSYIPEDYVGRTPIIVGLLAMALAKFIIVVGFYMHLKFDARIFTYMFGFGMLVATSVVSALMILFAQHPLPPVVPHTPPAH